MVNQKTIAVVNTKRRNLVLDYCPRYWAVGIAFGQKNYHVHVGPFGLSLSKIRH